MPSCSWDARSGRGDTSASTGINPGPGFLAAGRLERLSSRSCTLSRLSRSSPRHASTRTPVSLAAVHSVPPPARPVHFVTHTEFTECGHFDVRPRLASRSCNSSASRQFLHRLSSRSGTLTPYQRRRLRGSCERDEIEGDATTIEQPASPRLHPLPLYPRNRCGPSTTPTLSVLQLTREHQRHPGVSSEHPKDPPSLLPAVLRTHNTAGPAPTYTLYPAPNHPHLSLGTSYPSPFQSRLGILAHTLCSSERYILQSSTCILSCDSGTYYEPNYRTCLPCHDPRAVLCSSDGSTPLTWYAPPHPSLNRY